jgi:hypothetical protein
MNSQSLVRLWQVGGDTAFAFDSILSVFSIFLSSERFLEKAIMEVLMGSELDRSSLSSEKLD